MNLDIDRTAEEKQAQMASTIDSDQLTDTAPSSASNETIERATRTLDQLESLQRELEQEARALGTDDAHGLELPAGFLLSAVVPVYNERKTINRVISSLFALPLPVEVIAVDDGSTDGTCAMLTRLNQEFPELKVVLHENNQGKGAALRHGFAMATGTHVMVQDADLEYDPRDVPTLLEPLAKDEADVVYGSRFLEPRWRGTSVFHRWGNRALTAASNWTTGLQLTDMETCYKIFRRELLEDMELEQNRFGFEVEFTAKLAQLGARVIERPISYEARGWEQGKKISWRDGLQAVYCIFRYQRL